MEANSQDMVIKVEKFKKIDDVSLTLKPINIFIGANNSGKSSFIQGIQFAISSCQTLQLNKGKWVKGKTKTLSLDSNDFLYTPTSDISYLYHGKRLAGSKTKEGRNWIKFTIKADGQASVRVSRGKNGGFTTELSGKAYGEELSNIENPFCVYVPGIAGIPVLEKFEVPIAVKKSATRGDSNNYLRNILHTISTDDDKEKWQNFINSVSAVYGAINLKVIFDEHVSEFIRVDVEQTIDIEEVSESGKPSSKKKTISLPLDSVGTGLLQVIQIFAYIEYFDPKLILLDEPDSHIHPTKQKRLAAELVERTKSDPALKIVFSTHSRYILEALENEANVVHFQNGKALPNVKGSNILLDIGAADADYLFSKKSLKYVIVTEDKVDDISEKKEFLKKFLLANGLSEDEFVLHSYEGCSRVDFASILQGFVRKQIPTAKVILHLDRDQKADDDREIIKLKNSCSNNDIILFVTKYQEIESYFCMPKHIQQVYGIELAEAEKLYWTFIGELEGETKRKLQNFILREREELGKGKSGFDVKLIDEKVSDWMRNYPEEFTPGKELLGKIKNYIQSNGKGDPNRILEISEGLRSDDFEALLE